MEPVYFYRKKEDGTLCLTRVFAETDIAEIPERIDGAPVTEIGAYCFAPNGRYDKKEISEERLYGLRELAKDAVSRIVLPKSITKIGRNAFYNCKSLLTLEITDSLAEIESDVFMNCVHLEKIVYRGNIEEKNVLKQILAQISWNVELVCGQKDVNAIFFFPEYYEGYSEIGPAHIFELNIEGEGFRTRQCFSDNRFSIAEYDAIFPQAMAEESVQTLCGMAMNRIAYPYGLTEDRRQMYCEYLREHGAKAGIALLNKRDLSQFQMAERIQKMLDSNCLLPEAVEEVIAKAAELQMAELMSYLMEWKYKNRTRSVKKRYSLDDL